VVGFLLLAEIGGYGSEKFFLQQFWEGKEKNQVAEYQVAKRGMFPTAGIRNSPWAISHARRFADTSPILRGLPAGHKNW